MKHVVKDAKEVTLFSHHPVFEGETDLKKKEKPRGKSSPMIPEVGRFNPVSGGTVLARSLLPRSAKSGRKCSDVEFKLIMNRRASPSRAQ